MKKHIFAIAVLSSFSGFVSAEAGLVSSIDIYQIADTVESNSDGFGGLTIQQDGGSSANQINLVQGDVSNNLISIAQTGTGNTANIILNASLPGYDGEHYIVGSFADITQAIAASTITSGNTLTLSQTGSNDTANISILGSSNTIALTQTVNNATANIIIDGNSNNISVTQTVSGSVLNVQQHGDNASWSLVQ